jgi:hypothetical protein
VPAVRPGRAGAPESLEAPDARLAALPRARQAGDAPPPGWLWVATAAVIAAGAFFRYDRPWIAMEAPAFARLVVGHLVMRDVGVSG